jgi:hypothetical protein
MYDLSQYNESIVIDLLKNRIRITAAALVVNRWRRHGAGVSTGAAAGPQERRRGAPGAPSCSRFSASPVIDLGPQFSISGDNLAVPNGAVFSFIVLTVNATALDTASTPGVQGRWSLLAVRKGRRVV